MRGHGIPVSGPVVKEKAMAYAKELDLKEFKVSPGWLDRSKNRHGIVFKTISGEAKSRTSEMTSAWDETTYIAKNTLEL